MSSVSLVNGHIDEPRLTDEQIIKALECCGNDTRVCRVCPFESRCYNFDEKISNYALDLINRQKAEIERLRKEYEI